MNYLHLLVCKNDSFNDNNRFFRERKSGGVEKYFTYDIQMDQKREVFRQSFINVSHIWTLMGLPILFSSVPLDSSCQDALVKYPQEFILSDYLFDKIMGI